MYDPAIDASKLRFFTAETEIANFDENGRLGVGTSTHIRSEFTRSG